MAAAGKRARGEEGGDWVESDGQSHSDRMNTDHQDLKVENALLRSALWMTVRALKAGLSGAEPQEGAPTIAELAGRIKELQASNSVEAAPERTGTRRVSAEEPVTALVDNAAVENDRTVATVA